MTETHLPPRQPPMPPMPPSARPGPPPPAAPRRGVRRTTVALVVATTLAAGGIGGTVGALVAADDGAAAATASATTASSTGSTVTDLTTTVARVEPSVVQVNVRRDNGEGVGSGVIVDADGRILTNNHVVADADRITVTLSDGRTVDAAVEATDPASDLAVVRATGVDGLTPATFADSDQVEVGDEVIAIGSPAGLRGTVTTGIVSALDREVIVPAERRPYSRRQATVSYRAIQTDASINQGNSGGPLFDADGEVVGINSAIYSPVSGPDGSAGSVGIGFAIPSDTAAQVLDEL